jgi:hypothetical protein
MGSCFCQEPGKSLQVISAVGICWTAEKSLQQEWQFSQGVTDGIGAKFAAVESSLKDDFLPALPLGQTKIKQPLHDLLALLVKHASLLC